MDSSIGLQFMEHGSQICPTTGVSVINLEQCCVCSVFYEQPQRPIPQTDLNRMICKVLDVVPENSFFREYLAVCINCANLLRKFDRLRVELEFVKTQLVTYVIESLTQMRTEALRGPLDGMRTQILNRWTNGPSSSKRSRKEGFAATTTTGSENQDLSWAAHNNIMKNATVIDAAQNWKISSIASNARSTVARSPSPSPSMPDCGDDNYDDDGCMDPDPVNCEVEVSGMPADQNISGTSSNNHQEIDHNKKSRVKSSSGVDGSKRVRKRKRKQRSPRKPAGEICPLVCTTCGRIYSTASSLNNHKIACLTDDSYATKDCSICFEEQGKEVSFDTWPDFKAHVDTYHPFVPNLELCRFCNLKLLPYGLKRHKCKIINKQVDENPIFSCDRCDKAYNSRANLVDHVRRCHKDEKHTCEMCGKSYGSAMLLKFHVERHNRSVTKFKCSHCGVCLANGHSLKKHIATIHLKEELYQCSICDKTFRTKSVYTTHLKVHSNKKPEICHLCGKGFKLKSILRRHVHRHQISETNYTKKCPLCPKGIFRRIWILKKHMQLEHPGTAETEQILEKYKDVDDGPKERPRRIFPGIGRKFTKSSGNAAGASKAQSDSEDEFDEIDTDESDDEEEMIDCDVDIKFDTGPQQDSISDDTHAQREESPSGLATRKSARLKESQPSSSKRLVVLLDKNDAVNRLAEKN